LPNDSRYALIRQCLSALSDAGYESAESALEDVNEIATDILPVYTSDILQWFTAYNSRLDCCDRAIEEETSCHSAYRNLSTYNLLSAGWILSCEETLASLISSLEEERLSIFNPDTDCAILLMDSHGIYIPHLYCSSLNETDCFNLSIDWNDVQVCQSGPDAPTYWDAWQSILDSAEWNENGTEWRLYQSGDLFAIRADIELPEWF
jgi:hypothetical protein